MRKVIAAFLLLCGLTARAQFTAQWFFQDFTQNPQAIRQVNTIPLWIITPFGTNLIAGQRQAHQTDGGGTLTVSNMVPGAYRVEFIGGQTFTGYITNAFTNVFALGTTGLVNAVNFLGADTNHFLPFDGRYLFRVLPSIIGYVPTATDTNGDYTWQPGGGGGGSATNAYQSQAGNKLINIATNTSTFVYTFSGVDQTNGYPWGILYDAAGAALASTQALSLASGLAAFRATNSFASSNVATATVAGIVKVDNSSITVASDGTISAVSGGSGNVTGLTPVAAGNFPQYINSTTITNSGVGPSSFDLAGSAHAATNGWPWGVLYDPIGTAASVQSTVQSWLSLSNAQYQAQFANTVTNHDVRNLSFTGTHTNSGGVILPNAMATDTNAAVSNTNMTAWVYTNTIDVRGLASATTTNLIGIGSQSNALAIIPGTGLQLATNGNGTSTLNVTVTSGSSVFAVTNIFITNSTPVLLDFASFNVFKLWVETNVAWITTNSTSLTQKAYIYYHNDTNGGWALNSFANAGGLVATNANMQFTTNASALDLLEIMPGFWSTNILAYWPQNFQPRQAFTNSLSGGGGGGGGGSAFAFVVETSTNGATSKTTPAIDTTGATLIVAEMSWFSSTSSFSDSKGNTYTALPIYADHNGGYLTRMFFCTNPVVGSGHTFTGTSGLFVLNVKSFSGSSPAFEDGGTNGLVYGGGNTTSWQPGSVTPGGNGRLILNASTWNKVSTPPVASINSSFSTPIQAQEGLDALWGGFSHKIQTTGGSENPTWTFSDNVDTGSSEIAIFNHN